MELPRRELSPEEVTIQKQQENEAKERESQKKRIEENKKIRCPCCKKNQYFNKYLTNKQLGVLMCPLCGVLFIDQDKLKKIKKNIQDAKQAKTIRRVNDPSLINNIVTKR